MLAITKLPLKISNKNKKQKTKNKNKNSVIGIEILERKGHTQILLQVLFFL
jgi:hypothetical protein